MPHQVLMTMADQYIRISLIYYESKWSTVMSDFAEQLRLAEKAAEDIYFAKLNHELIESLHQRMQLERNSCQTSDQSSAAARAEDSPVAMKVTAKAE
jgi:hypothetical protein